MCPSNFIILFSLCIIGNVYGELTHTITVWNNLDPKQKPTDLFVHCKSPSHDIGPQNVRVGKPYMFPVKHMAFTNTLYQCTVKHGPNFKYIKTFKANSNMRPTSQGVTFNWIAKQDGIYFKDHTLPIVKTYEWPPAKN